MELTDLERNALERLHDDIAVVRHRQGYEMGAITVDGVVVLEAKRALAKLLSIGSGTVSPDPDDDPPTDRKP